MHNLSVLGFLYIERKKNETMQNKVIKIMCTTASIIKSFSRVECLLKSFRIFQNSEFMTIWNLYGLVLYLGMFSDFFLRFRRHFSHVEA